MHWYVLFEIIHLLTSNFQGTITWLIHTLGVENKIMHFLFFSLFIPWNLSMWIWITKLQLIFRYNIWVSIYLNLMQVEITCRDQLLLPSFTLQYVRDHIWYSGNITSTPPNFPSIDHVMRLQYRRRTTIHVSILWLIISLIFTCKLIIFHSHINTSFAKFA